MLRSLWKKKKLDKIQAGNNEIYYNKTTVILFGTTVQYAFTMDTNARLNFLVSSHFHVKYIFFCNRWRTRQPFKQASKQAHHCNWPSFNSVSSLLAIPPTCRLVPWLWLWLTTQLMLIFRAPLLLFKYLTIWTLEPQLVVNPPSLLFCPQNQVKYFTFWASSKTWQTHNTILFYFCFLSFLSFFQVVQ
jgi:hypothetical protein